MIQAWSFFDNSFIVWLGTINHSLRELIICYIIGQFYILYGGIFSNTIKMLLSLNLIISVLILYKDKWFSESSRVDVIWKKSLTYISLFIKNSNNSNWKINQINNNNSTNTLSNNIISVYDFLFVLLALLICICHTYDSIQVE